ncbi:MAG: magnesium transporter [Desulfobacterales bacterium]|jgi:magnesium transporter|nr:magnesium transporter [Desulfobacterales bacterium]
MEKDLNRILIDSINRLIRRNAIHHLRKIVNRTHAADLSVAFQSLPVAHQRKLFDMIDDVEDQGLLLSMLDRDTFQKLIDGIDLDKVVEIFEKMPNDDVADLIALLPPETSDALLQKMKREGSDEVEKLLKYDDETAGGIMVPDFIALKEDTTARDAIASLQTEFADVEMPFYLYAVDEYGKLVGVSSLRQLVVVPPETPLKSFITTDVISVRTDTDQEEVAKIVARYDILAVPVVDENHRLVGIVTVDDVIDIIRKEATEDILKMAGAGEEFVETKSILRSTRIRLPWLFVSCLGGLLAAFVIGHFEASIKQIAYLAAFIPVIGGMGGNIGTQSSTIVVRGLATGRLHVRDIWSVVRKELTIGFFLGSLYGLFIATVAQFRYNTYIVAVSAGLALICSMSIAALVGSLVPMLFERIKIDPAVATGPFVTTAVDIISVFTYFSIATALMGI